MKLSQSGFSIIHGIVTMAIVSAGTLLVMRQSEIGHQEQATANFHQEIDVLSNLIEIELGKIENCSATIYGVGSFEVNEEGFIKDIPLLGGIRKGQITIASNGIRSPVIIGDPIFEFNKNYGNTSTYISKISFSTSNQKIDGQRVIKVTFSPGEIRSNDIIVPGIFGAKDISVSIPITISTSNGNTYCSHADTSDITMNCTNLGGIVQANGSCKTSLMPKCIIAEIDFANPAEAKNNLGRLENVYKCGHPYSWDSEYLPEGVSALWLKCCRPD